MYDYDFTYNDYLESVEYAEEYGYAVEYEYDELEDLLAEYGI